jgi:hypothetical protein
MEPHDVPELKTPEEIAGYLALKHANGMPFKQVLDLHTLILTRIGRDYVETWGPAAGCKASEDIQAVYRRMEFGAFYVLNHLEDDDEWYDFGPKDDLTYE